MHNVKRTLGAVVLTGLASLVGLNLACTEKAGERDSSPTSGSSQPGSDESSMSSERASSVGTTGPGSTGTSSSTTGTSGTTTASGQCFVDGKLVEVSSQLACIDAGGSWTPMANGTAGPGGSGSTD